MATKGARGFPFSEALSESFIHFYAAMLQGWLLFRNVKYGNHIAYRRYLHRLAFHSDAQS